MPQWGCRSITTSRSRVSRSPCAEAVQAACPWEREGVFGGVRLVAMCSWGFDNLPDLRDAGEGKIYIICTSLCGTHPLPDSLLDMQFYMGPPIWKIDTVSKVRHNIPVAFAPDLLNSCLRGTAIRSWTKTLLLMLNDGISPCLPVAAPWMEDNIMTRKFRSTRNENNTVALDGAPGQMQLQGGGVCL